MSDGTEVNVNKIGLIHGGSVTFYAVALVFEDGVVYSRALIYPGNRPLTENEATDAAVQDLITKESLRKDLKFNSSVSFIVLQRGN